MSEYQYYEFVALDRPLAAEQVAKLRAVSSRAEISATRFKNEYHWGDLSADPEKLLERYFDAHLYFASWGTRRLILRLPRARTNTAELAPYFAGSTATGCRVAGAHVVIDLTSDTEEDEHDEEPPASLATFTPLRDELMRGDLRPAYLAWLLAVQEGAVDDEAEEPLVPAGLSELTSAQKAMAELLRIDFDLVRAAAARSDAADADGAAFRRWVLALPAKRKDEWLGRAADEPDLPLGAELLRTFRAISRPGDGPRRRTAAELRARAEELGHERELAEAARAEKARLAAAAKRKRHLSTLARDLDGAWLRLETLVSESSYDDALALALDLREIDERAGERTFAERFEAMRKRQLRRRGFFDRWKRAGG